MANNVLYVCIVSLPNNFFSFLFKMLVSLKVPIAVRKLSFCECAVFAAHHSSILGVHPCIRFMRTCDSVGAMVLHWLNDIASTQSPTIIHVRQRLKNSFKLNMFNSFLNVERSALFHNGIFHLIFLLYWEVVNMLSKTASLSPTPGMDTHLSTRDGCIVKN